MTATMDRPPVTTPPDEEATTETQPQRTKRWWKLSLPWPRGRTRNGAPFQDDPLILDNQTEAFWVLHLGFRELGTVAPRAERRETVVKTGVLTARILGAPTGTDYLTTHVGPNVERVHILIEKEGSVPEYTLRAIQREPKGRGARAAR